MANTDSRNGLTLIELIVCTVIIGILSATALPLSRNFVRREKEDALKENLKALRQGIDRYYDSMRRLKPDADEHACYPRRLEDMVENRILRRIPVDPMTNSPNWLTRSTRDSSNASFTDGTNVFDVFSSSSEKSFDGTPYSTW